MADKEIGVHKLRAATAKPTRPRSKPAVESSTAPQAGYAAAGTAA